MPGSLSSMLSGYSQHMLKWITFLFYLISIFEIYFFSSPLKIRAMVYVYNYHIYIYLSEQMSNGMLHIYQETWFSFHPSLPFF